jgi:hypothetical protein
MAVLGRGGMGPVVAVEYTIRENYMHNSSLIIIYSHLYYRVIRYTLCALITVAKVLIPLTFF